MTRAAPRIRLGDDPVSSQGLTSSEVTERGRQYGANDIVETAPSPWRDLARDTAKDPMLWFLGATAALYLVLGQHVEGATLVVAIVPLVAMDAFLHRRTQASTEGLRSRLAASASVVRDGSPQRVAATDLVPGDLVLVGPGEAFPADGLVVAGETLHADESMLTGEAYPVAKSPLTTLPEGDEPMVEMGHWAFAGTRLLTGQALVRVVFTGGNTLYGEIVRSALAGAKARTPLQQAIHRLVAVLVVAASAMCGLIALVRLRQGFGALDAFVSAVTLAAAALPEEFPLALTVFLGVGVYRLARRRALVRRAVSVENIGRVSCICSDKTGTMTEGRLRLTHVLPDKEMSSTRLLVLAALASRAGHGDALDEAILTETPVGRDTSAAERVVTFPFTETRRRESALVREPEGRVIAVTKGAAELILGMSALDDQERRDWTQRIHELAAEGHKVIACAWRQVSVGDRDEPDSGYTFAGLLALEDPVRDGVIDAVRACREAGIHTIMVTGDHSLTARTVAQQIGLGSGAPVVISGEEVAARAAAGPSTLRAVDVIARAVPAQKLALVRALQAGGEVVAVTGDGVNDVPALQAADVGIAMGERGTRSAREVAAIVLLDDNFRTIVGAVQEGRQLFRNLRLSFAYLLIVHTALVITAAAVPLAGYPLLYLPIHIVWLEALIHPTALLVFQDLPPAGPLTALDRPLTRRFFARREWAVVAIAGGLLTVLVAAGYLRGAGALRHVEHGRAMALVMLTLGSAAVTATLSGLRTRVSQFIVAVTVGLSVVLTEVPRLAVFLHLSALHADDWAAAIAGALLVGTVSIPLRTFRLQPRTKLHDCRTPAA
jgi:Ca2+-transporting ATPase